MNVMCPLQPLVLRCILLLLLTYISLPTTCLAILGLDEAPHLVFSDDFEPPTNQNPPPNWAMWGAEEFKVPTNYTRDITEPHGGLACFRIHHPAKTHGYVVSSPNRAIRPGPGRVYTVSFWARAEQPGKALFQWTAYQTINPFVDSPSPGSLTYEVDLKWRSFTSSIREGLDFFADESRYLLLTFHATTDASREQTLWVDDVRVTELPDPAPVALLNTATIPHETLEHRLRPGDRLEFTINSTNRLRLATVEAGGVSFHRVCGWTGQPFDRKGDYTLHPELETAIRELRLPMTRFYGVGDEPFGVESAIDKVAEVCRRIGVAQDRCVLEFEEQGASNSLPGNVGPGCQARAAARLPLPPLGDCQRALLSALGSWRSLPHTRCLHQSLQSRQ